MQTNGSCVVDIDFRVRIDNLKLYKQAWSSICYSANRGSCNHKYVYV